MPVAVPSGRELAVVEESRQQREPVTLDPHQDVSVLSELAAALVTIGLLLLTVWIVVGIGLLDGGVHRPLPDDFDFSRVSIPAAPAPDAS
ncbi:MAG: hypothetical protein R3249_02365 [Nitriliruptorales bacterium]|nr:hypothetical protein [Nitriliruptorales bacterium]